MSYAKFINENRIRRAPTSGTWKNVIYGNLLKHPEVLLDMGYKPIKYNEIPEYDLEKQYIEEIYSEEIDCIYVNYVVKDNPISDRKISKMKLFEALYKRGLWNATETFINSDPYTLKIWELAVTLQEQHPLVQKAMSALIAYASLTEEQVEEIIQESVAE